MKSDHPEHHDCPLCRDEGLMLRLLDAAYEEAQTDDPREVERVMTRLLEEHGVQDALFFLAAPEPPRPGRAERRRKLRGRRPR